MGRISLLYGLSGRVSGSRKGWKRVSWFNTRRRRRESREKAILFHGRVPWCWLGMSSRAWPVAMTMIVIIVSTLVVVVIVMVCSMRLPFPHSFMTPTRMHFPLSIVTRFLLFLLFLFGFHCSSMRLKKLVPEFRFLIVGCRRLGESRTPRRKRLRLNPPSCPRCANLFFIIRWPIQAMDKILFCKTKNAHQYQYQSKRKS